MLEYVATFRARYEAGNDVEAHLIAENIREHAQEYLDEDDDEDEPEITVTQVTSLLSTVQPEEVLIRLRQARNDLIRTGFKDCWQQAMELDKTIWALHRRHSPDDLPPDYDYGRYLSLARQIIELGENPL